MPKTGLTSLLAFMKENDFNSEGRNSKIFKRFMNGNIEAVTSYYSTKEFACGFPAQFMYKLLFEKFGADAKFILTVRKDACTWYSSICRHNRYAHPIRNKHHWVFGRFYPQGFKAEHIAYYQTHKSDVLDYFREQAALDRLLVLDVSKHDSVKKLEKFLEIEAVNQKMPHKNKGSDIRPGASNVFKLYYNKLAQSLYAVIAPSILKKRPIQLHPTSPSRNDLVKNNK